MYKVSLMCSWHICSDDLQQPEGGLYSVASRPTLEINQSSRGGLGKCSSPVGLSVWPVEA